MIKRIRYGSIRFCFWALLTLAISVSGLRFALSELHLFKTDIEVQLSQYLGAPVSIANIQGVLKGFRPELALLDIKIHASEHQPAALQLQEIHLGLDLLASFAHPLIESLRITIMGAKLSIKRLKSGSIAIHGLPSVEDSQNPDWLMQGRQFKLVDSDINWQDEKRNAEAIQLKHVNITIDNKQSQHKVVISMDLPEALGQSLGLAMKFSGNIFVPDSIDAQLLVQGKGIQLAKLITGDLPFDFAFKKGRGDFSLRSHWQATQMSQMQGSVQMNQAEIKDRQNNLFSIDRLALQFKLQKQQQQWQLAIQNSHLSSRKIDLEIATLAIALEQNDQGDLSHFALNCPQLDLGKLSRIMTRNKVLTSELHQPLQTLAIKGEIKDLLFLAKPLEETFAISGQLNQFHNKALDDIPGMSGLSLSIKGTEKQGRVVVNSEHMALTLPSQFRKALHFNHVLGELHWQQQADSWVLSSPMLALHTADIKTKNKLQLTFPKNEQPLSMNLQSYFYQGRDVAQIQHYLPVGIIDSPALVDWLDHAFVSGSIPQGGVLFKGALKDYPFTDSSGVFEVLFEAKNVDLHYSDNWPLVENLGADIRFFSESLNVNIYQGLAEQVSIKRANIKINSLTQSETLSIKGDITGELVQAVRFLQQTPYKEQISTVNKLVDMQGLFTAELDLDIPLTDIPARIDITAMPQNSRLHIAAVDLPVTGINGALHITEKGIFSDHLSAHILGFPAVVKIDSKEENTQVLVSGQTDSRHLADQFSNPVWSYLSGTSAYQLALNVPSDMDKTTRLQLNTDLEGVTVDFSRLSKSKAQVRPLSLDLTLDRSGVKAFSVHYKNLLMPENSLDIKLKKILPHWQGIIQSPFAQGSVFIPVELDKNATINFLLDELNLSTLGAINFKSDSAAFSLDDFPAINLESRTLYWQNHNLGKLTLLTEPSGDGLFIKQLSIKSARDELDLSGYWQQTKPGTETRIQGSLLSQNFGHLLQQLKLSENIIDATAELQFSLNWKGTPMEMSRQTINGDVKAYITDGRILGVEPGLGRVLGALDTWKLFKRLRFDFSDITAKGLSFTEITADVLLEQGLVSTRNFHINAMPAEINLTGTTHLETKELDLQATVLPKFPIAGTIIGNAANTVSKRIIGEQRAGGLLLSLLYDIKGTWEQFTINRQFSPALGITSANDKHP